MTYRLRSQSFCRIACSAIAALVFAGAPADSSAGLILSFTPDSSTIFVGQSTTVDVILTQTDPVIPGADITTNGITLADINLSLDSLAATVTGFTFGAGFEDSTGSDLTNTSAPLLSASSSFVTGVTASAGSPTSLTLGSFIFTGQSVGTTIATTVDSGLEDFLFFNDPGDIDSQVFGSESITLNVVGPAAVPEPGTTAILLCGMCSLFGFRRRRTSDCV